eukprot:894031-Heterocapsa_arctica.AAC.1
MRAGGTEPRGRIPWSVCVCLFPGLWRSRNHAVGQLAVQCGRGSGDRLTTISRGSGSTLPQDRVGQDGNGSM